jgi:hypothetical protein
LRERFSRSLLTSQPERNQSRATNALPDESVLALLLGLTIEFESDEAKVREEYDLVRWQHTGAPPFDDLIGAGWFRLTWGRLSAGFEAARLLKRSSPNVQQTLGPILERRHHRRFDVGAAGSGLPELASTIASMLNAPDDVHHLVCQTPEWIAARLWERAPSPLGPTARLRFWIDRCALLDDRAFSPAGAWTTGTTELFRETALEVLRSDPGLFGWEELRSRLVTRLALTSNRPVPEIDHYVPPVPTTCIDRYLWLGKRDFEHTRDDYETCGDLWHLVNLLLLEARDADQSAAPHPAAGELFNVAIDRPELLDFITLHIRQAPVLIADMLLEPRLAALACVMVAKASSRRTTWDSEVVADYERAARMAAFSEAVSVMAHFLSTGSLVPAEVAALLAWMYGQVGSRRFANQESPIDEPMFAT